MNEVLRSCSISLRMCKASNSGYHLIPREILAMADQQTKVAKVDKNNHEGGDEQSGR